ncbi:MAG: HdeD family acid-resistance protein [Nitrospirota bacterium]
MFETLFKYWWQPVVRGIVAIVFGVLAFVMPLVTLATLVFFIGAYLFVNGIFLAISAIGSRKEKEDWWLFLVEGLMSIGVGVVTYIVPGITAFVLVIYIAAWALATGVLEIVAAIRLRKVMKHEVLLALAGAASIVFAILLMWNPAVGALSLLWLIATYAIVFGVLLTILGIEVHHTGKKLKAI